MRSLLAPSVALGLVLGLVLAACGGAAPPPVEAPKAAPGAAAEPGPKKASPEDDKAAKAAALEALVDSESKKGACDDAHKAALDKLLADAEANMSKSGLQLVAKRVVALGSAPKAIELAVSGKGTEVHVLAYGARDVSLDVLVGSAAATTLRSPFQRSATSGPLAIELPKAGTVELQTDSRQVTIKPGQPIVAKVSGQGCAALVSFLKP